MPAGNAGPLDPATGPRRSQPYRPPAAVVPTKCAASRCGRAGVGEVALSDNEYKTAQRLGKDYWLYVAYNCAQKPELHIVRDPAQLDWKPVVRVEHYHIKAAQILGASSD